ncbi:hypothetical protein DLD77_00130 [Chitinophaga alhagiae]|uniref:DUF4625 domain-containing protein n=1 Tax=Chitinophaga alhagiae TaxID=2203219 RepID=A0ABM6W8D3_9BACT|nr:hypothetical protein [Chitinophaga alhagiae]AWO00222.1 hypothetical protein DLD77_00130 [Chitinophaga alhagiae]
MKKIFVLSTILITFLGCKKDPALEGNKPKLTFKSVSTEDVPADLKMLTFTFQLQDADGDTESAMFVNDIRFEDETKFDEVFMPALESHKGTKIDAEVVLYVSDLGDDVRMRLRDGRDPDLVPNPDTLQYRVFIVDNAGNSSDTLTLPKVAIHR